MAKSKSTSASAIVWNARSQAAYQGYSHLSGMEMTSPLNMWNHSAFRTFRFAPPRSGCASCSLSHVSTSKK